MLYTHVYGHPKSITQSFDIPSPPRALTGSLNSEMEMLREETNISFNRNWNDIKNRLFINNQSIHSKYKNEFKEIKHLESVQQKICDLQRNKEAEEVPDEAILTELQNQYDMYEEAIKKKKKNLADRVKNDFASYLEDHLGPERMHLIPQIQWLCSPKASTTLGLLVDEKIQRTCHGIFMGQKQPMSTISLHIPASRTAPIEITTTNEGLYDTYIHSNDPMHPVITSRHVSAYARYEIGLDGKIRVQGNFSLTPFHPKL